MKKEINASVHDIVDYVYAQGDIISVMAQKNNMRDGTLIHLDVQKQYQCDKEVYVKIESEFDDYHFHIQGRIDLLEKQGDTYHLIEIKSTHTFDNLEEDTYLAHFAQAKFYGYMLFHHFNLDKDLELAISVMYVNKYTYEKKFFTKNYTFVMLETFFNHTLNEFLKFQKILNHYHEMKLDSIKTLTFPFDNYRHGQRELIDKVSEVITEKKNLFVCAPTGIGKSLGTIYPAIQSIHKKDNKIFYLTSKSMIKDVARNAINLMRKNSNLKLKSLVITAKEKICLNDCVRCNPQDCIYAKDFYSRINEAVFDIFQNEDDFNLESIVSYAKNHKVCPFEYQLTLALFSDLIICDYNYVFDVRVYLRRFFDFDTSNFLFLIDEAHNMYDRVCGMFTASVNFKIIHEILDLVGEEKEIIKSSQAIITKLKQYQNHLKASHKKTMKFLDLDEVLLNDLSSLLSKLEKYFDKARDNEIEIDEDLLNCYFDLNNFLKISEFYNDDFMVWIRSSYETCDYQITCLNPRDLIKLRTDSVLATIFFSATLHPIDYYLSLLGGDQFSEQLILETPFKQENLQLYINNHISTKYNQRDDTKYQIAYQIQSLIENGGKYMIYFSSYQYLELVYDIFIKINEFDAVILKQNRHMTEYEKTIFLEQFDESQKNIVGFAVLGGIFAEGIDLKGEKLNGVGVIGVGLPMFDDFRNELKNYFNEVYQKGYQYAYMYPGFNKILQAVGRVIRDENDKGIALLIDSRYLNYEYVKLFPKHWSHYQKLDW
ncbi:DEAD/DEAH box helicase [Mycoplasmatota bacterium]|nr:DEAD/DEAH box helicase [Mycoplasmatota bacterium]